MDSLLFRWLFINRDDYYMVGQILGVAFEDKLIVKIRPPDGPMVTSLIDVDTLDEDSHIFETEADLDEWLAWMETPSDEGAKLKVVSMRSTKKTEH